MKAIASKKVRLLHETNDRQTGTREARTNSIDNVPLAAWRMFVLADVFFTVTCTVAVPLSGRGAGVGVAVHATVAEAG